MTTKSILFTALLSLSLSASAFNLAPTIIGGEPTRTGELPFMVSLQGSQGHYCGATLIKKNWILTAGHCVRGQSTTSIRKILIGAHTLTNTTGAEVFKAKKIVIHPSYDGMISNDYALIQLDGNSNNSPIELNQAEFSVHYGSSPVVVTAAGWGLTREHSWEISQTLLKVTMPLVPRAECERAYPGKITSQMLCAGVAEGGKDTCQADSGGPLFTRKPSGALSLVGVVSWGEGCGRPGKYGVYAKVSAVVSWIQTTTANQ